MKIDKYKYNIPKQIKPASREKSDKNIPDAVSDSKQIICNYAKAGMNVKNISFGQGCRIFSSDDNKIKIENYSVRQFQTHAEVLEEKYNNLPEEKKTAFKLGDVTENNIFIADFLVSNPEFLPKDRISLKNVRPMLMATTATNAEHRCKIINRLISDKKLVENKNIQEKFCSIVASIRSKENTEAVEKVLDTAISDDDFYNNQNVKDNAGIIILRACNPMCADNMIKMLDTLSSSETLKENQSIKDNLGIIIADSSTETELKAKQEIINTIFSDKSYASLEDLDAKIGNIIASVHSGKDVEVKTGIIKKVLQDENLNKNESIIRSLCDIATLTTTVNIDLVNDLLSRSEEITGSQIVMLLKNGDKYSIGSLIKLNDSISMHNAEKLTENDTPVAMKFIDLFNKKSLHEIARSDKRTLLYNLISVNNNIYGISENMKKMFPLLPENQEEYCSFLPQLVASVGIDTVPLTTEETEKFCSDMKTLSSSLSSLSDEEFNNLDIKQRYNNSEFMSDTLNVVKKLDMTERKNVLNCFGFELQENPNAEFIAPTGIRYSLTGYPSVSDIQDKVSRITDPETKQAIEALKPYVEKYLFNNPVSTGNEKIDKEINDVITVLPELHPIIGRKQHLTHDFDVFKHSLKVMQKVSQNEDFENLNDSDKNIILLAALTHDITKKEGVSDKTHADFGAFDASFIAGKFNLSQDEEIKLYTLIKNHEWLGSVNKSREESTQKILLQNISYDLRHDNMFDMALMFTHADLKAVKKDDSFHDRTDGQSRMNFKGEVRSFGESADYFAEKIRENIAELKKSQPLLPVTKFPKASTIDKAITTVDSEGRTNIKGVYKDKNGLIVIKFNEVEDWEAIGFAKGTVSKGIETRTPLGEKVDTGNIHFLVHGLDFPNQLAKFDVFSFADSDALLSVSYAERPESKYRFFRPQGIILDCDTKYIHGGGESDAGSGCGKNIQEFKNTYILGGYNENERLYISNMIKNALNFDDEQYIQFADENKNKPFSEITEDGNGEKIIRAFAEINSNTRKGNREYNEIYVSNPKPPMAVFAYDMRHDEKTGQTESVENPIKFLNREDTTEQEYRSYTIEGNCPVSVKERTEFLQQYALEHDIPFVVFGD